MGTHLSNFGERRSVPFWIVPVLFLLLLVVRPAALVAEGISAFSKAQAAYEERQLEKALEYAKEAVRQKPDHPDAYVLLGELYYLQQELGKAKESWEQALKLAPSRQDVRQLLENLPRETAIENSLTRSDTYPFIVRFAEGQGSVDLGSVRILLRDAYRQVGQQFQYFPDHSITVILYPRAAFEQVKGISHQVGGLYDGKIRLPLNSGYGSDTEIQRILWHEYTHAIVHDLARGRCPLWLNEGLATVQESRVVPVQLQDFTAALREGKLFPWDQFWDKPYEESQLRLCYEQAYVIAQYLVKRWGWEKMVGLLNRLGQGYPIADAIRAEYKSDPADIEKEWLSWAKRQLL